MFYCIELFFLHLHCFAAILISSDNILNLKGKKKILLKYFPTVQVLELKYRIELAPHSTKASCMHALIIGTDIGNCCYNILK